MKCLAVEVPPQEAERTRRWLADHGHLRSELRVQRTSNAVRFPVDAPVEVPGTPRILVELDFEETASRRPKRFRDLLRWTPEELEHLPRAFDVVGDVVLIRLPSILQPKAPEVGAALLEFVPGARVVGWDHGVHGTTRLRSIERIAGEGGFRTVHHENGLALEVDLEQAYFSPRLAREHARVALEVEKGELVYDLCCGVGPFSLLIARQGRASRVVAVDLNLAAIELLNRNLARLRPVVPVESHAIGLEAFLGQAAPARRVILNLPLEGIKYLTSVARVVAAAGVLHLYDVARRSQADARRGEALATLNSVRPGWTVRDYRRVHPYAPDADLVVYDFCRSGS